MTYQDLLYTKGQYKRSHIPKAYQTIRQKQPKPFLKHTTTIKKAKKRVKTLPENTSEQLVQQIVRNLLEIHILRLVQAEPTWGYNIIKKIQTLYGIRIRHGALYPLLNKLETNSLVESKREIQKGRIRKTYVITEKGKQLIQTYYNILKQQLEEKDIQHEEGTK